MHKEDKNPYELLMNLPSDEDKSLSSHTKTRRELAQAVFLACPGISHGQAAILVDQVLEEISEALVGGENVTLCNFGKFVLVDKKERKGRNPRTGDFALVSRRKVVSFRAARYLKSLVSQNIVRMRKHG